MIKAYTISFIRLLFMNLCIVYSFKKIRGYKDDSRKDNCIFILINIVISLFCAVVCQTIKLNTHVYPFYINIICHVLYVLICAILMKEADNSFFISTLMSICFAFSFYFIAATIPFLITRLNLFSWLINTVGEILLAGIIQILLIRAFFQVNRFKEGFSFIKNKNLYKSVNMISAILFLILVVYSIFAICTNNAIDVLMFYIIVFTMFLVFCLIKRYITKHYKLKMKDRTVEILKNQVQEKDKTIEELKEELARVHKINHKYNHRISSMEKAVAKLKISEEFARENGDLIELVEQLSEEYKNELGNLDDALPKCGMLGIDNILVHMNQECRKNDIEFELLINTPIQEIEKTIPQNKLETILADHIYDAIIAIKSSDKKNGKITVLFEKTNDINQIKIQDTGIEFEIETLLRLGKEQITTHKETGGNGIGFVTTFETLKETKASLEIEEHAKGESEFTKSIVIKCDGKNEYRIKSYRENEIKSRDIDNRIIFI